MQSLQNLRALAFVERDLLEERAIRFAQCRATADVKILMSVLAEHAIYTIPADAAYTPCFGRYVGTAAILQFFTTCHIEFHVLNLKIIDVIVDSDRAVVRSKCRLRHRGTGIQRHFEMCDILRFENGLIVDVTSYLDTLALAEARESSH